MEEESMNQDVSCAYIRYPSSYHPSKDGALCWRRTRKKIPLVVAQQSSSFSSTYHFSFLYPEISQGFPLPRQKVKLVGEFSSLLPSFALSIPSPSSTSSSSQSRPPPSFEGI